MIYFAKMQYKRANFWVLLINKYKHVFLNTLDEKGW